MKAILCMALLAGSLGLASAADPNPADLGDLQKQIDVLQKQLQERMKQLSEAPRKVSPGTTIVTGMGEDSGPAIALGILGKHPQEGAQRNAIKDAYKKCDALGGVLGQNTFKRDMFDDFWNSIGDDNKHVECGGFDAIVVSNEECTAWVKLECNIQ